MYRRLSFQNFKAWPSANLTFGRITGLFGTNSSGKTSVLQFLLLLKQTKDATDRALALELGGPLVALGTYKDFIHKHDENLGVNLSLAFDLETDLLIPDPEGRRTDALLKGKDISIHSRIDSRNGAPRARSLRYEMGDQKFSLTLKSGEETSYELHAEGDKDFKFTRTLGRPWQLPGPVKSYAFPDQVRTYYQNAGFLSELEAAYEGQMDRTYYLGPLREYPKREYVWTKSRPSDVGQRGERAIEAILAATAAGELQNIKRKSPRKGFQEVIAHWLREMGLIQSFTVEEIREGTNLYQAKVRVRKGAPEVLLTDVGFGVSQVLPVLTLLHYVPPFSTIILEQPEIHLHPLAQAGLADVIVNAATHRNVQIVVESHSEHFLLRLQRRIADQTISSDDVKLYFCDADAAGSKLSRLRLDLFGRIENWPKNFMGDAFGETAAAEKVRLKRERALSREKGD